MHIPVTIKNGATRMVGLLALYSVHSGMATLSFTFHDVHATVTEEDGRRLSGIFTSKRDSGRYKAALRRKRRKTKHDDSSRSVCYEGRWYNNQGRSGDFSIEWVTPSMTIQSMDTTLAIVPMGTSTEPVFLVPDRTLFDDQGMTIQDLFLKSLRERGIPRPEPTGKQVWKSWAKFPEGCGDRVRVRALEPMADFILAQLLRVGFSDVWHVMTPDRGYDSKDVNLYSKGGSKGRHQDAQPYGSLVFVFCAGLACKSSVWLKSGERRDLEMQSGDCMIFEGKSWHQVHECIPGTSPFGKDEWLADRRLSILVRQRPPTRGMRVPR